MKSVAFILFCVFAFIFASCPDGSIEFQNSCYFFYSNATQFPEAELNCNGMNGHLASVHDGFTNAIITSESSKFFHESTVTNFWVGLNSLMIPGNWSWTDNTTFDFKDWAPTEPQNLTQSCGAVTIQNGYWASDDCFKTKPYVCEVLPALPTTVATSPAYPAYMNCSYGFIYFEPTHSCYGRGDYGTYTVNWTTAEAYCEARGSHLVSLHSFEETKFVSTLLGDNIWTGLRSDDNEISWKWSDGSLVNYLPWYSGYPNRNISSCVVLWAEKIYDFDCASTWYTMCKKPAL